MRSYKVDNHRLLTTMAGEVREIIIMVERGNLKKSWEIYVQGQCPKGDAESV